MKSHSKTLSLLSIITSYGLSNGYGQNPENPNDLCCPEATKEDYLKLRKLHDNKDFIERISCDITRSEFDELYSIPQKPVMLVGCDDSWPAKNTWSMDQLAKRFDRDTLWRAVIGKEDEMDNDKNKHTPWGKIADAIANNVTFNLFDNIDDPHQQELINDYEWPLFARNTDVHDHFENIPPQDYGSMRWFGAGSPFTGTDVHYDPYDTDAWNTVVQGEKWWFLMPFEADSHFALHCSPSCSTTNPTMLDKYIGVLTSDSPEIQEFNEKYVSFTFQKAGETLYLPTRFLHSVLNTDFTIFITGNYLNQVNLGIEGKWDFIKNGASHEELKQFYCNEMSEEERDQFQEPIVCDETLGQLISHQVARYGDLISLMDLAETDFDSLHAPDNNGWTPIHEAAAYGSVTSLRFLLENEADINARTASGLTPLDIVKDYFGEDHNAYAFLSNYETIEEYTPHHAAAYGDLQYLQIVHQDDPEVIHEKDENGWAPIHEAASNGNGDVLDFLLRNESDVHSETHDGLTPLDIVSDRFGEDNYLFRLLLDYDSEYEPEL